MISPSPRRPGLPRPRRCRIPPPPKSQRFAQDALAGLRQRAGDRSDAACRKLPPHRLRPALWASNAGATTATMSSRWSWATRRCIRSRSTCDARLVEPGCCRSRRARKRICRRCAADRDGRRPLRRVDVTSAAVRSTMRGAVARTFFWGRARCGAMLSGLGGGRGGVDCGGGRRAWPGGAGGPGAAGRCRPTRRVVETDHRPARPGPRRLGPRSIPAAQTVEGFTDIISDQGYPWLAGQDPVAFLKGIYAAFRPTATGCGERQFAPGRRGGCRIARPSLCGQQHGKPFGVATFYKVISGDKALYSINRDFRRHRLARRRGAEFPKGQEAESGGCAPAGARRGRPTTSPTRPTSAAAHLPPTKTLREGAIQVPAVLPLPPSPRGSGTRLFLQPRRSPIRTPRFPLTAREERSGGRSRNGAPRRPTTPAQHGVARPRRLTRFGQLDAPGSDLPHPPSPAGRPRRPQRQREGIADIRTVPRRSRRDPRSRRRGARAGAERRTARRLTRRCRRSAVSRHAQGIPPIAAGATTASAATPTTCRPRDLRTASPS